MKSFRGKLTRAIPSSHLRASCIFSSHSLTEKLGKTLRRAKPASDWVIKPYGKTARAKFRVACFSTWPKWLHVATKWGREWPSTDEPHAMARPPSFPPSPFHPDNSKTLRQGERKGSVIVLDYVALRLPHSSLSYFPTAQERPTYWTFTVSSASETAPPRAGTECPRDLWGPVLHFSPLPWVTPPGLLSRPL